MGVTVPFFSYFRDEIENMNVDSGDVVEHVKDTHNDVNEIEVKLIETEPKPSISTPSAKKDKSLSLPLSLPLSFSLSFSHSFSFFLSLSLSFDSIFFSLLRYFDIFFLDSFGI